MLLKIHVEGQTEQAFIGQILNPYLKTLGYTVSSSINPTSPGSRGGLSHYQQFKTNTRRVRKTAPDCLLTTMIDLYGLPNDFPGMSESSEITDPYEKVTFLEAELQRDLAIENFIPYIQLHEFEALLFSDVDKIDQVLSRVQPSKLSQLQGILRRHHAPEKIDSGRGPSCHLRDICDGNYQKITRGIEIAKMIELPVMREKCPHFNEWLEKLENYANARRF